MGMGRRRGRADGPRRRRAVVVGALLATLTMAAGTGLASAAARPRDTARVGSSVARGRIAVVAAENEYGDVAAAIGGKAVSVTSIMRNPNTDPHTFEASVSVARAVAAARLVIQNGAGYDGFMRRIEAAAPSASRTVIDVRQLLGLPAGTRNPHLWYAPSTMPSVAKAIAADLSRLDPRRAGAFRASLASFEASLRPWRQAIARLRARFAHLAVAATEPVADDLVAAAGLRMATPWVFQADVMNGVDPSPQLLQIEEQLISRHEVRALLYNVQVTDPLTSSLLALAHRSHVPTVAVYETMPTGFHYGSWMDAETTALEAALSHGRSTARL